MKRSSSTTDLNIADKLALERLSKEAVAKTLASDHCLPLPPVVLWSPPRDEPAKANTLIN